MSDPHHPTRTPRQRWLWAARRATLTWLVLLVLGLSYSLGIEPRWLAVSSLEVPVRHLPPALEGFTLAHITDPHIGLGAGEGVLRRAVARANAQRPDLVVLTGDFLDGHAARDPEHYNAVLARELAALDAPHGVFAVLGNHDHDVDVARVVTSLHAAGVTLLRDDAHALEVAGETLWLLGVEDGGFEICRDFAAFRAAYETQAAALADHLAQIPADEPRLLLVHNPDFSQMLPPGRVDLVLAGHTHGGYVRLPLRGAPISPSCFGQTLVAGLAEVNGTPVYVNRGIGGFSIRFRARPEVALLRLVAE